MQTQTISVPCNLSTFPNNNNGVSEKCQLVFTYVRSFFPGSSPINFKRCKSKSHSFHKAECLIMMLIFLTKSLIPTFLYKWPYVINSKRYINECYACTIVKQGRATMSKYHGWLIIIYSTRAYWTTFLFCIPVLFLQQEIEIIMAVNTFGACYVPDTVLSNLNVLAHLILTPWQWVPLTSFHSTETEMKHPKSRDLPACFHTPRKRQRQDLNGDSWLMCTSS